MACAGRLLSAIVTGIVTLSFGEAAMAKGVLSKRLKNSQRSVTLWASQASCLQFPLTEKVQFAIIRVQEKSNNYKDADASRL